MENISNSKDVNRPGEILSFQIVNISKMIPQPNEGYPGDSLPWPPVSKKILESELDTIESNIRRSRVPQCEESDTDI